MFLLLLLQRRLNVRNFPWRPPSATTPRCLPWPTPAHPDLSRPGTHSGDALGRLGTHGSALVADTCRRCSRWWWCPKTTSDDCPKTVRRPPKQHHQAIPKAPPLSWSCSMIPLNPTHAWEAHGSAVRRISTHGVIVCNTQRSTPCRRRQTGRE